MKPRPRPTHCRHGHEYTEANTARDRDGFRLCRACARIKRAARRAFDRGGPPRARPSQEDIILRRVVGDPNGCWIWQGVVNRATGYTQVYSQARGRTVIGHRLAYETFVGPIPDGLEIDHLCRVKVCINPAHLEPVTRGENSRRAHAANRRTHCKWGHEFTEENTYVLPSGNRNCKSCRRQIDRARSPRRRAAS